MKNILKVMQVIIQVITIVLSIFTVLEVVNHTIYKMKLKKKASEYLEDEFVVEANIKGPVAVDSPTVRENKKRIGSLLAATGVGCIMLICINFIKASQE